ncbi:ABC transporter ATP-binding protein [Flavobacterium sharifuzzamanii]|uniref:ABC transporter ATP-binding protein n=1 Tax=Flavobacterium sharifuzzamanii TaxID=2211133 RepID=UPI000DADAEEA|nr:ABC transporter ATP-binding protein [Flavobacterium sharifuzzamanii]KAF2081169.1 ABC transporter ATP-binding protein [Flavobacterium sharifuzzamanii]
MQENEVLIKVEGLSKKFCKDLKTSLWYGVKDLYNSVLRRDSSDSLRKNEFWAVKDISFELRRGECLGLIGHNGAGKSTLLKMLNGLINPDQGKVTIKGRVGALIELGAGFNPILTGRENIYNNGAVLGFSKSEIDSKVEDIIDFAEVREFIDMPVQNYSSGMKVRLGFAIAAQMEPDVLIIDEVLAVGDLAFRMKCYTHLMKVMSKNVAIILVSHSVVDIMRLCSVVATLEKGKSIFQGNVEKGVSIYNNLANKESKDSSIISAKILSDDEENDFYTGDDINFQVDINSEFYIEKARILFHLEYSNIRLSSISSKYSEFNFDIKPGLNSFNFQIKNTPLLVGGYLGRFELYGESLKDYIASANFVSFNIVGPKVDYSGFGICHTIKLEHEFTFI